MKMSDFTSQATLAAAGAGVVATFLGMNLMAKSGKFTQGAVALGLAVVAVGVLRGQGIVK